MINQKLKETKSKYNLAEKIAILTKWLGLISDNSTNFVAKTKYFYFLNWDNYLLVKLIKINNSKSYVKYLIQKYNWKYNNTILKSSRGNNWVSWEIGLWEITQSLLALFSCELYS